MYSLVVRINFDSWLRIMKLYLHVHSSSFEAITSAVLGTAAKQQHCVTVCTSSILSRNSSGASNSEWTITVAKMIIKLMCSWLHLHQSFVRVQILLCTFIILGGRYFLYVSSLWPVDGLSGPSAQPNGAGSLVLLEGSSLVYIRAIPKNTENRIQ